MLNLTKASEASERKIISAGLSPHALSAKRVQSAPPATDEARYPRNLRSGHLSGEIMGGSQNWHQILLPGPAYGAGGVGMGTMVLARCNNHKNSKFENFGFSRFLDFASKNRGFTIFFLRLGDKITWF